MNQTSVTKRVYQYRGREWTADELRFAMGFEAMRLASRGETLDFPEADVLDWLGRIMNAKRAATDADIISGR